jgi:hypothetical protein
MDESRKLAAILMAGRCWVQSADRSGRGPYPSKAARTLKRPDRSDNRSTQGTRGEADRRWSHHSGTAEIGRLLTAGRSSTSRRKTSGRA